MNLIHSDFEILEQNEGLKGIYEAIEYPGRICYGSTDKICDGSADKFVKDILMKSNHGAPMEHGAVYLDCPQSVYMKYKNNQYSRVNVVYNKKEDGPIKMVNQSLGYLTDTVSYYVSTNFRVLFENNWLDDLKYICTPTQYHTKRITVKFTCDIGVSREFNRHRKDSPNEESTRYCNYSKDKFGAGLNVIEPCWLYDRHDEIEKALNEDEMNIRDYCGYILNGNDNECFNDIDYWLFANLASEYSYMNLLRLGWKPQQARTVLPLDTKTILVHTAFIDDWKHFLELRALGTTGAPHPQAKELAEPLMKEFENRGYIKVDYDKKEIIIT